MGLLKLTESERLEILNLHNNARVIKEQATPVVPASSTVPTAATTMDRKTLVTKIQDILKTKYNANLGTAGPNQDGVDGNLGPKTLAALTTAMANKSKATPAAPAATTTTATPAAPAATTTTATPAAPAATKTTATPAAPAATTAQTSSEVLGTEVGQPKQPELSAQSQQALAGQLTPQQIRQQGRFDQRLARQARRNERRAGQQGQQQ